MTRSRSRLVLTLLVTFGLMTAVAGPGGAQQFENYDKFEGGPLIDPEKWQGISLEGSFGQPTDDFVRVIDEGQLRLLLVAYGNSTSDSGVSTPRLGLALRDLGTPGGSRFIIGMKAEVTVRDAELQDCPANPDDTSSRTRAELFGSLFHDATPGDPGDATGNIAFQFQIRRDADGVNRISAHLHRCTTVNCSQTAVLRDVNFASQWSLNTPLSLKFVWQKANHRIKFIVAGGQETQFIDYSGALDDTNPPRGFDFKHVRLRNSVENCSGARKRAVMDALFDNIKVKRDP